MAWNLAEFSKIETDPTRKTVVDDFLIESPVAQLIPWETIGALATGIVRYQDLPSVAFRKVNEALTESTGHLEQKTETISLAGLYIDTDKAIARAKNTIADARGLQQKMAMKAFAYWFNYNFIIGDPATDPESFRGITKRVDDIFAEGYTDQKFACNSTSVGILNTAATSLAFIDDLDKLCYAIAGHSPDFLLMNKKMLMALRSALRKASLLNQAQDMFGRTIDMYGSTKLIDIGTRVDQKTEIILNTETTVGVTSGGTECTSIYAVKFGIGDMLWGIQEYPMEIEDLGLIQTAPVYRTQMDWNIGLADVSPRCMARMYGIVPDTSS